MITNIIEFYRNYMENSNMTNSNGLYEPFDETQLETLKQLSDFVDQQDLEERSLYDDWLLIRFLRESKWIYNNAAIKFEKYLKFREEYEIGSILTKDTKDIEERISQLRNRKYSGVDKDGQPIVIEQYMKLDKASMKQLFNQTTEDELLLIFTKEMETMIHSVFPTLSQKYQKRIEYNTYIIDCKKANCQGAFVLLKQFTSFLGVFCKAGENYYPFVLKRMIIVNAPKIFSLIYKAVQNFLPQETSEKISILGKNYKEELEKYCDLDQLPDFLGGEVDMENCKLPWDDHLKECVIRGSFFASDAEMVSNPYPEKLDDIKISQEKELSILVDETSLNKTNLNYYQFETQTEVNYEIPIQSPCETPQKFPKKNPFITPDKITYENPFEKQNEANFEILNKNLFQNQNNVTTKNQFEIEREVQCEVSNDIETIRDECENYFEKSKPFKRNYWIKMIYFTAFSLAIIILINCTLSNIFTK